MQVYKYETHTHTSLVSRCSRITPENLVRYYKKLGYSGVFITDHFLNGNTTVSKELSWQDQIHRFCDGYDKAFKEGQKIGLDVFFGLEYSYEGTDFLTYGLDKQWLLDHPDLLTLSLGEYCDLVRAEGGIIVHAHPFREDFYIDMIRLIPRKVDAIEVLNAGRTDFENDCARQYADTYQLKLFAGTDTHHDQQTILHGIQLKRRLENERDMIQALNLGEIEVFSQLI